MVLLIYVCFCFPNEVLQRLWREEIRERERRRVFLLLRARPGTTAIESSIGCLELPSHQLRPSLPPTTLQNDLSPSLPALLHLSRLPFKRPCCSQSRDRSPSRSHRPGGRTTSSTPSSFLLSRQGSSSSPRSPRGGRDLDLGGGR